MRFFSLSIVCLTLSTLVSARVCHRAACNADNCARAAYGTAGGLASSRLAACSSFFSYTAAGTTVTSTVTVTNSSGPAIPVSTVTALNGGIATQISLSVQRVQPQSFNVPTDASITPLATGVLFFPHANHARSVGMTAAQTAGRSQLNAIISPSAVPSWASACSDTARYSSACSCAGIRPTTVIGEVTTVTQTVTVAGQPASQAVQTVTASQTATATVINILQPTGYACDSTVQVNQGCNCFYQIACGRREIAGEIFSNSTTPTEVDCLNTCDSFAKCDFVNYNFLTRVCNLVTRQGAPRDPIVVDDANTDSLFAEAQLCQNKIDSGLCH